MVLTAHIPRAVQLVLDDVGWREGWSLNDIDGPWRAGVERLMEPADYEAIAQIGKRLNMRPQAVCVLCEWDKENICAECASCTADGASWDNSARAGQWSDEVADIFQGQAANIELTMHGVGHEYWDNGRRVRAEWYGAQDGKRWPWDDLVKHTEIFSRILDQHGLGPAAGHRFPVSAVPCAFNYYFDDGDAESTGALYRQAGVERCSTPFGGGFHVHSELIAPDCGYDHGMPVIDRASNGVPYDAFNAIPAEPVRNSICGIHWPNVLMEDPARNQESVERWAEYLAATNAQPDMMLAANSAECFAQWVYHTFVATRWEDDTLVLDGSGIPDEALPTAAQAPLWVKVRLPRGRELSSIHADRITPVAYTHPDEYVLIGFQGMGQFKARVRFEVGESLPPAIVLSTGTFNVLGLSTTVTETVVEAEIYGHQQITMRMPRPPASVHYGKSRVTVSGIGYDAEAGICYLDVSGHDIQGERLSLSVNHASA